MKICPMLLRGRSKGELSYIRGAIGRGDREAIEELLCLKELCAWFCVSTKRCAVVDTAHGFQNAI